MFVYYRSRRISSFSSADHLKCPFCNSELSLSDSYDIHILNNPITCQYCCQTINPENLYVAAFLRRHASGFYGDSVHLGQVLTLENTEFTWVALTSKISDRIKIYGPTLSKTASLQRAKCISLRKQYKDIVEAAKGNLSCVSLDLVKGMYRQLDFINKICVNFHYWYDETIINASIARYFKFMQLMKTFGKKKTLVPTMDIDLVWHTHQAEANDYSFVCNHYFHRLIDHDDTIPGEDLQKGYTRTFIYWSRAYNEAYSSHPPDYNAYQRNHTSFYSPFGLYRQLVWKLNPSTHHPVIKMLFTTDVPIPVPVAKESAHISKPVCVLATPVNDSTYRPDNNLTTNIVPVMAYNVTTYQPYSGCGGMSGGCGISVCAVVSIGGDGAGGCGAGGGGGGGGGCGGA